MRGWPSAVAASFWRKRYERYQRNSSRPATNHKSSNSERLRLLAWINHDTPLISVCNRVQTYIYSTKIPKRLVTKGVLRTELSFWTLLKYKTLKILHSHSKNLGMLQDHKNWPKIKGDVGKIGWVQKNPCPDYQWRGRTTTGNRKYLPDFRWQKGLPPVKIPVQPISLLFNISSIHSNLQKFFSLVISNILEGNQNKNNCLVSHFYKKLKFPALFPTSLARRKVQEISISNCSQDSSVLSLISL